MDDDAVAFTAAFASSTANMIAPPVSPPSGFQTPNVDPSASVNSAPRPSSSVSVGVMPSTSR
jgi:hypothetical protein